MYILIKKSKQSRKYEVGDTVVKIRMQLSNITKLKEKYLGAYEITADKNHDRREVEKIGDHADHGKTSTEVEYIKPWPMG